MEDVKPRELFLNPYVCQMDKFADSLHRLSRKFLSLERKRDSLTEIELEDMVVKITDKVCGACERRSECLMENPKRTNQMVQEILLAVEEYGAELNIELKRKLQKQCVYAPRFLRETLEIFENAKQVLLWNNKMIKQREGYAGELNRFAQIVRYTARELDAGIFTDERLERKIKNQLKKSGIKVLSSVFYMTPDGKYEIHLTAKSVKGQCVATKDMAKQVGQCVGKIMMPEQGECPILGEEYRTIACVEGSKYFTLQGIAKIGKNCEKISGDTFLMTDLPGGKKGVALSDGMGSGEKAFKESTMVIEMLEELLEAGFPVETAIQMLNTVLVIGRDEVHFSTIDLSMFDLYSGKCEIVKAGATTTFIKRKDRVEDITSVSLPIGVLHDIEIDTKEIQMESGDFVIMVTDGVMDALPIGNQEEIMKEIISEKDIQNPRELAHFIMGKVLETSGTVPCDDMTILVVGIWKR